MLDTHAVALSLIAADFTPAQADALTHALRLVVEQGDHVTSEPVSGRHGRDAYRNRGGYAPELIVRGRLRVCEVPIGFADRRRGKSKLHWRQQLDYFRHLGRLYAHVLARVLRRAAQRR